MESSIRYHRPSSDGDWEIHRDEIISLYMDQKLKLETVRQKLRDQHGFDPSEKQWKNQIKKWGLRKYLKGNEAQQILDGTIPANQLLAANNDREEAMRRAERSLKRKRTRIRNQTETEDMVTNSSIGSSSHDSGDESTAMVLRATSQGPTSPLASIHTSSVFEKVLYNIRQYTHEAHMLGHFDSLSTPHHLKGRQAARSLASELSAGRSLSEKGKKQQALVRWGRAQACLQNPDLWNTWYHETPIRLLFEIGRLAHSRHGKVASMLLQEIKVWSRKYLDEDDPRYALFQSIGDLSADQLRAFHVRAAQCQYRGLASRLEKHHQLLYEIRLNRALDLLGFDDKADLSEWLPSVEEVDQALGENNPYSIYFLLLQAYRLVGLERYREVDEVCKQVTIKMRALQEAQGVIDSWRVGLAYRRLGRHLYAKKRYEDARRSLSTALKYVKNEKDKDSVLIEICQNQESMARAQDDEIDVLLWSTMLQKLEQSSENSTDVDQTPSTSQARSNHQDDYWEQDRSKRRCLPGSLRQESFSDVEEVQRIHEPPIGMTNGLPVAQDFIFTQPNGTPASDMVFTNGVIYSEPGFDGTSPFGDFGPPETQPEATWTFGVPGFDFNGLPFGLTDPGWIPFQPVAQIHRPKSMTT